MVLIMQDATELSMQTAKKPHVAVLQELGRGCFDWSNFDMVEKVKDKHSTTCPVF